MATDFRNPSVSRTNGSMRCNGSRIAKLRKQLGWTQSEFAKLTGYSERLVRKAEASGKVMPVVMCDLAKAFSAAGQSVSVEHLTADPEFAARSLLSTLCTHGSDWMAHAGDLISDQVVLHCAGDRRIIPFAGRWRGKAELETWSQIFCNVVQPPDRDLPSPQFLTSGDQVVVWGIELWESPRNSAHSIEMSLRMQFSSGKLVVMEILFDTDQANTSLRRQVQGALAE